MARETSVDRRARIAKMQAQQKSAERRRLMVVVGACALVLLLIVGSVAWVMLGEKRKTDSAIDSVSVDTAAASCDPVTNDPAEGSGTHVGPGTNKPDVLRVDYKVNPPSTGEHFPVIAQLGTRRVYKVADVPPLENMVHNLEHGYTILFYDPSLQDSMAPGFTVLAERINKLSESGNKFFIAPWDTSRGALPAGKKFVLSHWSADVSATGQVGNQMGHRQFCGGASIDVISDFVKKHPWSSAPEPGLNN